MQQKHSQPDRRAQIALGRRAALTGGVATVAQIGSPYRVVHSETVTPEGKLTLVNSTTARRAPTISSWRYTTA
jgi:hypothetical protein